VGVIEDKLASGIERKLAERRRMVAAVRAAYQDGRWQAATPEQRRHTRMNFRILNVRLRRDAAELARRTTRPE
jgi:hypothetical protein